MTNDNAALFATQPAISANGTLTYAPAPNVSGVANVPVTLRDNGGVDNGCVDTSAPQTFTITVAKASTVTAVDSSNLEPRRSATPSPTTAVPRRPQPSP